MKHQNKEQHPPSRRSRRRSRDGAIDTSPTNPPAASKEVTSVDPIAASVMQVSGASPTPLVPMPPAPAASVPPAPSAAGGSTAPTTGTTGLRSQAEQIVRDYVPLAVGAGMIPLPGFDLAAIGGLQLKVLASLAQHYKVPFTRAHAQLIVTSLLGSVGTTFLAGAALVSVAKIVPFFGMVLGAASMPVAGGVITLAMGNLAIDHFEAGGTMETFDLDLAQQAFLKKIGEAKVALV